MQRAAAASEDGTSNHDLALVACSHAFQGPLAPRAGGTWRQPSRSRRAHTCTWPARHSGASPDRWPMSSQRAGDGQTSRRIGRVRRREGRHARRLAQRVLMPRGGHAGVLQRESVGGAPAASAAKKGSSSWRHSRTPHAGPHHSPASPRRWRAMSMLVESTVELGGRSA